jgi:hypothetical protein
MQGLLSELRGSDEVSRSLLVRIANYVVTESDIQDRLADVVELSNAIGGPQIVFDMFRNCYGLFADRDYKPRHALVTKYGGKKHHSVFDGDYSAKLGNLYIDGKHSFKIAEKGRWINEFDSSGTFANVELGREIRTRSEIKSGEQFFADYGREYQRSY